MMMAESRSRKSERELTDVRKERDGLKSSVAAGENSLKDVRGKLGATQTDLQKLGEEKSTFEAEVQARNIEVADLKMQLALLSDQLRHQRHGLHSERAQLLGALEQHGGQACAFPLACAEQFFQGFLCQGQDGSAPVNGALLFRRTQAQQHGRAIGP